LSARKLWLWLWPLAASLVFAQDAPSGAEQIAAPPVAVTPPNCLPHPLGGRELYLRGSYNQWGADEAHQFRYHCDHFELVTTLAGAQTVKVADEDWSADADFGGGTLVLDKPASLISKGSGMNYLFAGAHRIQVILPPAAPKPIMTIAVCPTSLMGAALPCATAPESFATAVTDPVALSLRFDSRATEDKAPFGAIPNGTTVAFALSAMPGVDRLTLVVERRRLEGNQALLEYTRLARIPLQRAAPNLVGRERWSTSYTFKDIGVYGYHFEVEIAGSHFVYQNNSNAVFWTREKGSGGLGAVGAKSSSSKAVRRFRQTVYAADYKVPDWARDAVYYCIFPDRFRNGDPTNDPEPLLQSYQGKAVEFHANWLAKPYRPGSGDGSDSVYNNDFFGGDIAGIIEKLDYIAELGANTLYITPLFQAASNHKYDTADYRHIDRAFGSNEDFERLTREAAKRGLRVIPDASLNHTGSDSIYFDRLGKYGGDGAFFGGKVNPKSPYADWYSFDTSKADPDKQFKGWVGVGDLPELNKGSRSYRDFAYGGQNSVMKQWLNRGAAGWRMDVAPWVPDDFWREWRSAIKRHRPDALTIAETWFDASKFFLGDSFDSTMNYIFRNTVLDYAAGGDAKALYENIEQIREAYPAQSFFALMNLLSSHDQARALHQFGFHSDSDLAANIEMAKQRLRLAVFFQMVFPGAPAVYYGDEVGVTGGDDPYNRGTYPWADRGGQPDTTLLADFKRLIAMRKEHAVLRHGSLAAPLLLNEHVIVLARQNGNSRALTATNNATTPQTVTLQLPAGWDVKEWVDALTSERLTPAQGRVTLTVPALFGTVLLGR
jgi:glycosidase